MPHRENVAIAYALVCSSSGTRATGFGSIRAPALEHSGGMDGEEDEAADFEHPRKLHRIIFAQLGRSAWLPCFQSKPYIARFCFEKEKKSACNSQVDKEVACPNWQIKQRWAC